MLVWIFFRPFLIIIILMSVTPCFPRAAVISFAAAKARSRLLTTPFDFQFFMEVSFTLGRTKHLHFENVFSLPPAVNIHKQVSVPYFFLSGS